MSLGVGVGVAGEHHLGAEIAHRLHFDVRRRLRHDDERVQLRCTGRVCHALRVIAGAGRDDAACTVRLGNVRDPVVGAAELVAEDRLQIFAFQQHLVLQPLRQTRRRLERRFLGDIVDAAVEDEPQHLVRADHAVGRRVVAEVRMVHRGHRGVSE